VRERISASNVIPVPKAKITVKRKTGRKLVGDNDVLYI
jgi:hypothetical protein